MIKEVEELRDSLKTVSTKLRSNLRKSSRTGEWAIKSARADVCDVVSQKLDSIIKLHKKEQDAITKTKS
jgi:hypothetical protein